MNVFTIFCIQKRLWHSSEVSNLQASDDHCQVPLVADSVLKWLRVWASLRLAIGVPSVEGVPDHILLWSVLTYWRALNRSHTTFTRCTSCHRNVPSLNLFRIPVLFILFSLSARFCCFICWLSPVCLQFLLESVVNVSSFVGKFVWWIRDKKEAG